MAVLSPALVIAMCVMFVLTRMHRHHYIFEHPFLFGLIYCLEPAREQLQAMEGSSSDSRPTQQTSTGKKQAKQPQVRASSAQPKPKLSAASLSVRRTVLNETFFSSEAEFPYHREFDHLMAICCGYLSAYAFEEAVNCFYPNLLANKRSAYVAVFGVGFAVFESLRISIGMTSVKVVVLLIAFSWLVALSVISAGDFISFVRFDEAFTGLGEATHSVLVGRLRLDEDPAKVYARTAAMAGRFLVATVASLISASVAAPARYFSKLDYDIHRDYREEESDRRDDPYYLGRPTAFTMFKISLDYVVPSLAVFMWCVSQRRLGAYGSWRIVALWACVLVRMGTLRIRLQAYLDGAIDAYRSFWKTRSASNSAEAGRQTTLHVIKNSFYLIMITTIYVGPALVPLLLACIAKLDGAVEMGVCPVASSGIVEASEVFTREVAGFLSWWSVAAYLFFAVSSIMFEIVSDLVDPGARDRRLKVPPPGSASERRKQRRMAQQTMHGNL